MLFWKYICTYTYSLFHFCSKNKMLDSSLFSVTWSVPAKLLEKEKSGLGACARVARGAGAQGPAF